ncbi:MAG: ribosome small subunit-dependent GTPase A [Labilithrix sp.]|nr:ribosome small subunit-dependent GTPase A [Labilithrix sp.]MCW5815599.1 ribosome small subunit-dependent GTPase A [Labilithrix sp.]
MVTLEELGFPGPAPDDGRRPARVASVHAVRVDVWTTAGPVQASLRSRFLRIDGGVAVGDFVLLGATEDVVEEVLPRRTVFLRQAAGDRSEPQAIAANVDRVFVVTSAEDWNLRRLERYLVAIATGGAEAQIVLSKSDLGADVETTDALAPSLVTSAKTGAGLDELRARIPRGMTVAFVGSSGVGKSALVNVLLGRDAQLEGAVRAHDGRGRHTTTRRELFAVPGGGLLIDTPGMRELKPWLPGGEVDDAFDDVASHAARCRYRDCAHESEPGCAVREAVAAGDLAPERLEAWRKLARERSTQVDKSKQRTATLALRKRLREKGN